MFVSLLRVRIFLCMAVALLSFVVLIAGCSSSSDPEEDGRTFYVNAVSGVDEAGGGSVFEPFLTLTFALGQAAADDIVLAAPGHYDQALGEDQQITVPADVTLRGEDRHTCIFSGMGTHHAVELSEGSVLESFSVAKGGGGDNYAAVHVDGVSAEIRDLFIDDDWGGMAIHVEGEGGYALIEECELVRALGLRGGTAIHFSWDCGGIVRGCEIREWNTGINMANNAHPRIENCVITDNTIGVTQYWNDGETHQNGDLGGGPLGSEGGNTIRDNTRWGVYNMGTGTIYAKNCVWNTDPPSEGEPNGNDIYNEMSGAVIWE